jgi:hypothetical protein
MTSDVEVPGATGKPMPNAFELARFFHQEYERLAPDYGYETKKESAVPWEQVPLPNRRLMVAVAESILNHYDVRHSDGFGGGSDA